MSVCIHSSYVYSCAVAGKMAFLTQISQVKFNVICFLWENSLRNWAVAGNVCLLLIWVADIQCLTASFFISTLEMNICTTRFIIYMSAHWVVGLIVREQKNVFEYCLWQHSPINKESKDISTILICLYSIPPQNAIICVMIAYKRHTCYSHVFMSLDI